MRVGCEVEESGRFVVFVQAAFTEKKLLSMKDRYELGQKDFDALLGLFSANREEAGEKYEQVRRGLVRFFQFKGCSDPQSLTDETINRVAAKLDAYDPSKGSKPASYFYGFASNILKEYRRNSGRESALDEKQFIVSPLVSEETENEPEMTKLRRCIEELEPDEKDLVLEYYGREGRERIDTRRRMCDQLNCSAAALYTRISRIKNSIRDCIEACAKERV
jgi:RNA polymerase sigma factor (sigma-70 family)